MLKETPNVRQIEGDPPRRWFADDFFDLIVWFSPDGSLFGFQLCYDWKTKPRAFTWLKEGGYRHDGIDDGEALFGAHKSSPVLVKDGLFDKDDIGARFEAESAQLPKKIRDAVLAKIREYNKPL